MIDPTDTRVGSGPRPGVNHLVPATVWEHACRRARRPRSRLMRDGPVRTRWTGKVRDGPVSRALRPVAQPLRQCGRIGRRVALAEQKVTKVGLACTRRRHAVRVSILRERRTALRRRAGRSVARVKRVSMRCRRPAVSKRFNFVSTSRHLAKPRWRSDGDRTTSLAINDGERHVARPLRRTASDARVSCGFVKARKRAAALDVQPGAPSDLLSRARYAGRPAAGPAERPRVPRRLSRARPPGSGQGRGDSRRLRASTATSSSDLAARRWRGSAACVRGTYRAERPRPARGRSRASGCRR